MKRVIAVALGGAVGSILRYGIQKTFNHSFPAGTLSVNITGCFFAGCLLALLGKSAGSLLQLFLLTGFCGGFTTFSAFSVESLQLLMSDRLTSFLFYSLSSIAGGLLATFIGYQIFRS